VASKVESCELNAKEKGMRKLVVFNHVSLDGYFVDANGEMSWAKGGRVTNDPEWDAFVAENASGKATLIFGRVTYDLMASFWPTPFAVEHMPEVAERMNSLPKIVFSRSLEKSSWNNTTLVNGDPPAEIRKLKLKGDSEESMVILGSGTIVSQLAQEGLIDEYQFVVNPVVLGKGRTMFDGVRDNLSLKLTKSRTFGNGNVYLSYEVAQTEVS
jgi:dihydrofolate reductase